TLREFSQGAIQTTSAPLDAAVQGDGFFVVQTSSGAQEFTRGGNFQVAKNGDLITATGETLQGWGADASGTVDTNGPVGNIVVPVGTLQAPVATKNVSMDLNLNAAGVNGTPTGTYSHSLQVYDSLGEVHTVTFNFTKSTTSNQWDYSVSVPDADLSSPFTAVTGSLTFDSNGNLTSPASTDPAPAIAITGLADGAADLNITWNLFNGTTPRVTQYTQASAVAALSQDGSATASLLNVAIADGGQILAQFSDGQQSVVGQLALATIRNPDSLVAVGNNNYQGSAETALPAVGVPGTAGRGTVLGGAVEASTVDIAAQFTNLIVFQRGYEAASKVITTADQISQTTINLKQ
ncbi:MAG: flagellar hook protein FlgE, partial [Bryobacteraceae bacterium]